MSKTNASYNSPYRCFKNTYVQLVCNRSHIVVREAICGVCYENINYCSCSYTKTCITCTHEYVQPREFVRGTYEINGKNIARKITNS